MELDSAPETFAEGLCNVECPTVGPDGWILNVCSVSRPEEAWPTRGGDITATHLSAPSRTHVVVSTSTSSISGIPAALAFGPDDALYVCDEGRRAVVRIDATGDVDDYITHADGKPLNGPNDLSFDEAGNLYFTDPWTSSPLNPVAAVCGADWATGKVNVIDSGMQFTNGIVVDGERLLVAETYTRMVWQYDVTGPGEARDRRAFCQLPDIDDPPLLPEAVREAVGVDYVVGPDGMCLDEEGNLYVAHYGGGGVWVYDHRGAEVGVIRTPGRFPTNVCFGGEDMRTLFVSVDDPGLIVTYRPGPVGRQLPFCPSLRTGHPLASAIPREPIIELPGHRTFEA